MEWNDWETGLLLHNRLACIHQSFLSSNMAGRPERILYNRICVQHNFSCAWSPDDILPLEPQMLFGILGHVDIQVRMYSGSLELRPHNMASKFCFLVIHIFKVATRMCIQGTKRRCRGRNDRDQSLWNSKVTDNPMRKKTLSAAYINKHPLRVWNIHLK